MERERDGARVASPHLSLLHPKTLRTRLPEARFDSEVSDLKEKQKRVGKSIVSHPRSLPGPHIMKIKKQLKSLLLLYIRIKFKSSDSFFIKKYFNYCDKYFFQKKIIKIKNIFFS